MHLRGRVASISQKMLIKTLKQLKGDGVIMRRAHAAAPSRGAHATW
jgi:DNA-binding HxlR family transcriptional regulator